MGRKWKLPLLSKLAWWLARKVPDRVAGAIWLEAYNELESHYRWVHELDDDGSHTYQDTVSAHRIETLRRKVFREFLKAELEE